MKNSYNLVVIILVIVIAVLSLMLINNKKDVQLEGVINQVNQTEKTMTTEQKIAGLDIKVLKEGVGRETEAHDFVLVHYTGKLTDGTVFDSSIPRGEALDFRLGDGRVIAGWEKGLIGMKIGEKRELTIAPELAYGAAGITAPNGKVVIPENATLIFEVEMLSSSEFLGQESLE